MRLPVQAFPVVRGVSRSKPARTLTISESYGSCLVSCIESALDVSGLEQCGNLGSTTAIVSCIVALAGLSPITVAAEAAGCAIYAGFCSL